MKTATYLGLMLGAALLLSSCANQQTTAYNDGSRRGLVGPGSVAPVSGGPAAPRAVKQKFQP